MQADEITLAVDEENDGVGLVNHVFTRFDSPVNRGIYIGPNHTMLKRNTMGLYRSFPRVSGNFRGVAKTAIKFTEDIEVAGVDASTTLTAPMIAELSFSFPVGTTAAQTLAFRQKMLAVVDLDSVMAPLNDQQMV